MAFHLGELFLGIVLENDQALFQAIDKRNMLHLAYSCYIKYDGRKFCLILMAVVVSHSKTYEMLLSLWLLPLFGSEKATSGKTHHY